MMVDESLSAATIAAHGGGVRDAKGAVAPGIQLSSTFARQPDYTLPDARNLYQRDDNDTVRQAEEVIRQLEGAAETRLFSSGMAAASALFRTVPTGGRIILQSGIYYGVTHFLRGFCARRGITLDEVDTSDLGALTEACAVPADLVWVETPSNPWLKITNLRETAKLAHSAGARLAVDATAASPVLCRPLDFGADFVMHSATKVLNGHSDLLAGVVSCADPDTPMWQALCAERHDGGGVIGPFEAWLLLRGMRTLPLRLERMCKTAQHVAEVLSQHLRVEAVWYPGLPGHPQHALALAQMSGAGGYLMSVLVKGGATEALSLVSHLRLIQRATSLGGVESLIEHRHSIEPHSGIPENLLRVSIGIEDPDDLITDLTRALDL